MNQIIATDRTPQIIAVEINSIKEQTRKMVLHNAIEIGRRLCEAKEAVPHGEWGNWLDQAVDFKQSTANNLMRIFEEYGNSQMALFGETGAKSQAIGKLSYTQAVALLAIPNGEREEFLEENDVENMSTRELQRAIKERDEALTQLQSKQDENDQLLKSLEKEKKQARKQANRFEADLNEAKKLIKKAKGSGDTEEVKRLEASLQDTAAQLEESNNRIAELEEQIKNTVIDVTANAVAEKIPDEVQAELDQLRKSQRSAAASKFAVHFDNLVKGFSDLLTALSEIGDPDEQDKYRNAVSSLISKMNERL